MIDISEILRNNESFIRRLDRLKLKYMALIPDTVGVKMILNINNWIRDIEINIQRKDFQDAMNEYIKSSEENLNMSMNAHHCCIVFSNNYDTAKQKLEEILQDKLNDGVDNLIRIINCKHSGELRYIYEDEEWVWVSPSSRARGYRAHKAYVDSKCSYQEVYENIKPYCSLYCKDEDFKFFNW